VIEHSGAWAGYRAQLLRLPKLGSVIVLCNAATANPPELARKIADIVFEKQLGADPKADPKPDPKTPEPAPITLTDAELDVWVGAYREATSGTVALVKRDQGLTIEAGQVLPLVALTRSLFRIGPTKITLEFSGTKPKRSAILKQANQPEQKLVEVTAYKPAAAELAALAGRYWCAELGVMWMVRIDSGVAVLDGPNLVNAPLAFSSPLEAANAEIDVAVIFVRGARAITGFGLNSGTLRGLRFERL